MMSKTLPHFTQVHPRRMKAARRLPKLDQRRKPRWCTNNSWAWRRRKAHLTGSWYARATRTRKQRTKPEALPPWWSHDIYNLAEPYLCLWELRTEFRLWMETNADAKEKKTSNHCAEDDHAGRPKNRSRHCNNAIYRDTNKNETK